MIGRRRGMGLLAALAGIGSLISVSNPHTGQRAYADEPLGSPKPRLGKTTAPGFPRLGRRFWRGKGNQHTPGGRRKR